MERGHVKSLRIEASGTHRFVGGASAELHEISGDAARLTVSISGVLLRQLQFQSGLVDLSGYLDLRLFQDPHTYPLPRGTGVTVPGIGVCRDGIEPEGWISFSCISPLPRVALMAGIPGERASWIVPPGSASAPIASAGGLRPLVKFTSLLSYRNWEQIGGMYLRILLRTLPEVWNGSNTW